MSEKHDSYEKYAATYDRESVESQWHGPDVLFGAMFPHIKPGESLLDLGIGTGLGSLPFHKAGLRISGLDSSLSMLKQCEKRELDFELTRHELEKIPWPYEDDRFDHAISTGVFHFLGGLDGIVTETARVLKPGGLFGFDIHEYEPDTSDGYTQVMQGVFETYDEEYKVRLYRHTMDHVLGVLSEAGFEKLHDLEFLTSRNPKRYFRTLVARLL